MPPETTDFNSLNNIQKSFMRALHYDSPDIEMAIAQTDTLSPRQQRDIYRNSHIGALQKTLAEHYPVTRKLVGDSCFYRLARVYIAAHPCTQYDLNYYGAKLPELVASMPALAELHYLKDMATMEWAWHCLDLTDRSKSITTLSPEISARELLRVKATWPDAATILSSRFPIERIWYLHLVNEIEQISLEQGTYIYFIYPHTDGCKISCLNSTQHWLLQLCRHGSSLSRLATLWKKRLLRHDFSDVFACALANQWLNFTLPHPL